MLIKVNLRRKPPDRNLRIAQRTPHLPLPHLQRLLQTLAMEQMPADRHHPHQLRIPELPQTNTALSHLERIIRLVEMVHSDLKQDLVQFLLLLLAELKF